MFLRRLSSLFFPTQGLPAPWTSHTARCFAPTRLFATLAAVQKKNSLCEPNFENAQLYDLKGSQHENPGNSEQQVAQADGVTNPTLRPFAPVREPSPLRPFAPIPCFATLAAVQKKNSPCEPNFENAQPYDSTGERQEIGTKAGHQVAQHDRITNRALRARLLPSGHPCPRPHSPQPCSPNRIWLHDHRRSQTRKMNKQTQLESGLI